MMPIISLMIIIIVRIIAITYETTAFCMDYLKREHFLPYTHMGQDGERDF